MFKKSYNRAVLRLRVETVTPLLIRAGDAGLDPTAAELSCVRTRHAEHGSTVYIPGSSLKGVVRSCAEASVRGRRLQDRAGACGDPLRGHGCEENRREQNGSPPRHGRGGNGPRRDELSTAEIHRQHCLCCRLFGSTEIHGRASVRDLFPWPLAASSSEAGEHVKKANDTEIRYGVSIDRALGSVKNGPFESEVVPAGALFWGEIALVNYQVYQLGLLFQAFDELNDGFAQLGSSKSRGLGVVKVRVDSIVHEQSGDRPAPLDVAALAAQDERKDYGLLAASPLPAATGARHGLAVRFLVEGAAVADWRDKALAPLAGAAAQAGAR